jgi:hypothetical protein
LSYLRERLLEEIADDAALERAAEDAALLPYQEPSSTVTFDPLSYDNGSPVLTSLSSTGAVVETEFKLDDDTATPSNGASNGHIGSSGGGAALSIDTIAVTAPALPAPFAVSATVIAAATVAPLPPSAHYVSPGPLAPLGTVVTRYTFTTLVVQH